WIQINAVDASPNEAGTAYVAATAYKLDDYRPFLYKTKDFGKSWKKIVSGIPEDAFTRVVREDPNRKGFLYAGTETGMYFSADDGENWRSLRLNLPIVPITDLAIHKREQDLVVATQGRSFYVLDNLPLLYQMAEAQSSAGGAFLFKPEDAYRTPGFGGFPIPAGAPLGRNPANGAVVNYYLKNKPKEVTLEFLDASGKVLRRFTGRTPTEGAEQAPSGGGRGGEPNLPTEIGLNQFVWNYRLPSATNIPGMILWGGSLAGPRVVPGSYQVRLSVDGKAAATDSFAVKADPRIGTTAADFQKQFDLLMQINQKLSQTHGAILEIRDLRKQLEDLSAKLKEPAQKDLREKAAGIMNKLSAVEEELIQTKIKSSQDALNYPIKLNNKLAALASAVDSADYAPTNQSYDVYNDLTARIDPQIAALAKIKAEDIAAFNRLFAEKNLPVITTVSN
ncbi:MAG TPA: hypothetical protein VK400_05800, partial [Pyrinomonadaceae bacterium]|nr:hypothetical protein [Pyrinomonadaceae bacterium]